MIIVWLSLGLIGVAIIWFIIQVIARMKSMKDTIIDVAKQTEKLRKDSESIIKHQERLQDTTSNVLKDVEKKREAISFTQRQTQDLVKQLQGSKDLVTHPFKNFSERKYKV